MEGDPAASIEARVRAIDVDEARRALAAEGVAVIRGVVPSDLLQSCLHAARDEVTAEAFYSCSHHNAFLVPDDHPAALADPKVCATRVRSSKTCITGDMVPPDNPLAALHACESFARVVAAIVGEERLYPTADELGGLNVHVYGDGDELGWHFDRGEFAVTVMLQCPSRGGPEGTCGGGSGLDAGGAFEYVTGIRSFRGVGDRAEQETSPSTVDAVDEFAPEVVEATDAVIRGDPAAAARVRSLRAASFSPGDVMVLRGRRVLHRVTPVRIRGGEGRTVREGERSGAGSGEGRAPRGVPRVLAVLSFETTPGVQLNDYTRMHFFGRRRASDPVPQRSV